MNEIIWTEGDPVRFHEGRTLYSFTAKRGSWSTGVYAYDLKDAKRRLEERSKDRQV